MKKLRVLSIVLLVALIVGAVPANAASVNDFTDVPASAWYYDYVKTAVSLGLINGATATTFAPNATMTRGQFVTVLGRYEGVTDSANTGVFTDVRADMYYAVYVYWAYANGIVTGTGATAFSPDANLTREQMAALIVRYAESKGIAIPAVGGGSAFKDADKISGYAKPAVEALKKAGIMTGDDNGNCNPQAAITRAEATALFVRFLTVAGLINQETDKPKFQIASDVTNQTLDIGETVQIATVFYYVVNGLRQDVPASESIDRTLTYSSNDTTVATVNNRGVVTAVNTGTTIIWITASNGATATIQIAVRDVNAAVVGIDFLTSSATAYTITDGDNIGYFFFTEHAILGEPTITQERVINSGRSYTLFWPRMVYEDGYKTAASGDYISIYSITYSSSNPGLVSANSDGTITVNRVLSATEGSQTVTITATSSKLGVSKSATITVLRQSLYDYSMSYAESFGKEFVRLVNIERTARGLSALVYDSTIFSDTVVRAQELARDFTAPLSSSLFTGKTGIIETKYKSSNYHICFYSPEHAAKAVAATMMSSADYGDLFSSNAKSAAMGLYFVSGTKGFYCSFITAAN